MESDRGLGARVAIPWFDLFMSALLVAFLTGGLISGYLFYRSVRSFVARSQLVNFPTDRSTPPASQSNPLVATNPPPEAPVLLPSGESAPSETVVPTPVMASAMNILIMGIDKRDGEQGPFRTDTMILVHVDPAKKSAAMLSIPRDLLVQLPDYGYGRRLDRINTANVWGDVYNYPGGGPALAKKTIENNFGVTVDRYIVIDFQGFEDFIDLIGGIDIDVPEPITDHEYPTPDYGYMTIHFDAGPQHMDGETALIYARTRKSSSDFARAARQQQVMLAVREKVLSRDIIPKLTPANLLAIAREFNESVQTDLTIDEMFALAHAVNTIPDGGIRQAVIDSSMVYDGADFTLIGRWNKIHETVAELFDTGPIDIPPPPTPIPPTPTPIPTPTPVVTDTAGLTETVTISDTAGPGNPPLVIGDDLGLIEVRNGTNIAGLEDRAAIYLQQLGLTVSGVGPADRADYPYTILVVYNESSVTTVNTLVGMFGIASDNIRWEPGGRTDVDIVVVLGADALHFLPSG